MSDLTKRDAEILMHLVDAEIKRICDQQAYEQNPAKIIGECKHCGHLFDVCRNGLCCDLCGETGVRGARWADTTSVVVGLDPDTTRDVVWLEKLYSLSSAGSQL